MNLIPTFSSLEATALLYGFSMANILIDVFIRSGVIFIPLVGGLYLVYINTKKSQPEMVGDATLSYIAVAFFILIMVVIPFREVGTKVLPVGQECTEGQSKSADSISPRKASVKTRQPADGVPRASMWWILTHKLSSGIINQIINQVPCYTDHNLINMVLSAQEITDPVLQAEYRQFTRECYSRALSNYAATGKRDENAKGLSYIGNKFFVETPGYYRACAARSANWRNPCRRGPARPINQPVGRWEGLKNIEGKHFPYPVCRDWWLGDAKNKGLRDLLYEEAVDDSNIRVGLGNRLASYFKGSDKDWVVKRMLESRKQAVLKSGEFGLVEGGAAAIGLGLSPAEKISAGATELLKPYIVKRFMAILQPVMLFALAVFFPIFFLIAGYSFQSLMTYTVVTVAIKALPAILVISNFISNFLAEAAGLGLGGSFNSLVDRAIFEYVAMWLPIILSIVFVIVLGWAGSRAGGFVEGLYSGRGVESGAIGAASSVSPKAISQAGSILRKRFK